MESGEKPVPAAKNPFWKPAISILFLALAYWYLDRSQNFPVFSVLGILGIACAIFAAAVAVLGHDRYHRLIEWVLDWLGRAVRAVGRAMLAALRGIGRLIERYRAAVSVATALVLSAAGVLVWLSMPSEADTGCPHPGELRLLTTAAGLAPYRELASRYERYTADQRRDFPHCPTEHLYVYAAPPDLVAPALVQRWRPDGDLVPEVALGPQPDAWLPESTVDVRVVQDLADRSWLRDPVLASRSIGSSALVLASMAPIGGLPAVTTTTGTTWPEAVEAVISSGAGLLAPDPQASTAGLLAMSTYLRGASGLVGLNEAHLRQQLIDVSGAVLRDDDLATVCRFAGATGQGAGPGNRAVITSRQTWRRYMSGQRLGESCPAGKERDGRLVSLAGSPVLDHPLVGFDWTTNSRRAALDAFVDWLETSSGDDARRAIGLDPPLIDCKVPLMAPERGQDPKAPKESPLTVDVPCLPKELEDTLSRYREAQRPGAVLLAVDASGSMGATVGRDGPTRLAVAVQAVDRALDQIGPLDAVGVWTFGGQSYANAVPAARGDQVQQALVAQKLGEIKAGGATPMYVTVLAGLAEIGRYGRGEVPEPTRALVLLTDGEDSGTTPVTEVAAQVQQLTQGMAGPRLFIVATGSASCAGAKGLRLLTDAGRGTCYDTELNQVGQTMAALFESLWKGQ